MGLVPIWHGRVSDDGSKIEFAEGERFLRRGFLKTLAGKPIDVVIRQHRGKRSDRQNRWWWGVAIPLIAQHLGYDKHEHDDVHYALVARCFGTHRDEKLGQELPNVRSSQLKTDEFSQLMEWAVRFAATEWALEIPMPSEAE